MLCAMHALPPDWLVPDWPAPANVKALFTSRNGGISTAPYGSFNLGLHVGDDAKHVAHNRSLLQAHAGVRPVYLNQVHGQAMVPLVAATPDALTADGAYTSETRLACTVMVADCLPVLFCDAQGRQVAAAHAGWRGLLGVQGRGVLEAAASAFVAPADLLAWLGPCIGPRAFEVGDEVRAAFVSASLQSALCFEPLPGGKWLADLPALAKQRLQALGIGRIHGNDGGQEWCTASNPSHFYSHRRDRISGRMAACIWLSA
jgi:hypothetical protein